MGVGYRAPGLALVLALAGCSPATSAGGTDSTSGTDGTGPGSTGTDSGGPNDPDLDAFFDPNVVQEFRLDIAPADRQAMFDALPELIYVPATFHWNEITVENVGVRFKGNSSSSPGQTHKRSYLIKFHEYVKGQRFQDLRRLSLDNGIQFGSLFSERLVTDILREQGATISRSNYCRLVVNDEYQGVYVNVERVDKSFLKHHFADPDGPLYKVHEGGPGAALDYVGDDPLLYSMAFENKGDAIWDGDFQPLVDLISGLDGVPQADFPAWLDQTWDAESLRQDLPVLLLAGAFDQLTGWNAHNYYVYREPGTGRWTYIPWDLDVGFADNAFGQIPVLSGWNAAYPYPVAPRPLLARYLADDGLKGGYRALAAEVLETHFHPDVIVPRLHALHDQLLPHLADDPFPPTRITNPEDTDYAGIVASLEAFMQARYARAAAELADPQDTPPAEPDPGPPPPGDPTPQDPSDLMVVSVSGTQVELSWTDNSPDEGVFVLQRCTGAGCVAFAPLQGLDPNVTTAVDMMVTPGDTYRYRVYALIPVMGQPSPTGPSNEVEVDIP